MPVYLEPQELDSFLKEGHTVIFTTLDRDGYPHSTPLWYVYLDGHIYTRTMRNSHKARNAARDHKVCCLVETGEHWRDLKAVVIRGRAEEVADQAERERVFAALAEKYAAFRQDQGQLPGRVQQHYSQERVVYRVVPEKKVLSWDNRKVRLRQG
ncbi:MAG: pyridoxamine 5'-phosphate oxidase family protein [Chloroflexi bacterium]|nr:pyridoxamine 5'-phosphate oxidase family protein [Chloroflexota bacterium]